MNLICKFLIFDTLETYILSIKKWYCLTVIGDRIILNNLKPFAVICLNDMYIIFLSDFYFYANCIFRVGITVIFKMYTDYSFDIILVLFVMSHEILEYFVLVNRNFGKRQKRIGQFEG